MLKQLLRRLGSYFGNRQITQSSFVTLKDNNGKAVGMMDRIGADFFSSPKPSLTKTMVDQLFEKVTHVQIVHKFIGKDGRYHPETLLNITDPEAFSSLHNALEIIDEASPFHVWSVGDYVLEFYATNTLITSIELLSARTIRWDLLHGDAHLRNIPLLCNWLAERGVEEPLRRYYAEQERAEKYQAAEERWKQATPACLLPFWDGMSDKSLKIDIVQTTLETAYPDPEQRALELFRWFGSGEGPWSGYPIYEMYPEELLLNFPTDQLVSILLTAQLTESHLEGAARYFAGWTFNKQRGAESALLPVDLRQRLLHHCLTSSIKGNHADALLAFSTD